MHCNTTSTAKDHGNKAKRLEGEAVMSAPPLFQSAGRGDVKFWGEDDRPTVVVWESLSESDQEQWSLKRWACRRIGWFGAGRGKKTKSNARLKSMQKKSSQTAASKPNPKQERRQIRKKAKGSQCAGKCGGDRATSNAQCAKSMLRAGFTKIVMWQTRPEY